MGNGGAEELICMTHGHELRWRMLVGGGVHGRGELRGEKKWDNYNSIINKIYLKISAGFYQMLFQHLLI